MCACRPGSEADSCALDPVQQSHQAVRRHVRITRSKARMTDRTVSLTRTLLYCMYDGVRRSYHARVIVPITEAGLLPGHAVAVRAA